MKAASKRPVFRYRIDKYGVMARKESPLSYLMRGFFIAVIFYLLGSRNIELLTAVGFGFAFGLCFIDYTFQYYFGSNGKKEK